MNECGRIPQLCCDRELLQRTGRVQMPVLQVSTQLPLGSRGVRTRTELRTVFTFLYCLACCVCVKLVISVLHVLSLINYHCSLKRILFLKGGWHLRYCITLQVCIWAAADGGNLWWQFCLTRIVTLYLVTVTQLFFLISQFLTLCPLCLEPLLIFPSPSSHCERIACEYVRDPSCLSLPLKISFDNITFPTNISVLADVFRMGPSNSVSGDDIQLDIVTRDQGGFLVPRDWPTAEGSHCKASWQNPRISCSQWRWGSYVTGLFIFIWLRLRCLSPTSSPSHQDFHSKYHYLALLS